jgi:hypothetical protein
MRSANRTAAPPAPFVIEPNTVYVAEYVRAALRLKASSLRSEWRAGRLRVLRRCGRNFFLGRDLLAWLSGGELRRRPPAEGRNSDIGLTVGKPSEK